ncbi:MAG TPA: rod shape-determining protein RodA [Candidatus Paceibacterota bacterium]|nr:rod shape-determining protein RodA [Candidatus Paceibacterota bacterium]
MAETVRALSFRTLLAEWPLVAIATALSLLGLVTMNTYGTGSLAPRQLVFIVIGVVVYFLITAIDARFLRRTPVILSGYVFVLVLLVVLLVAVHPVMGARSWFDLGLVSFQPTDLVKLVLIALLAKYFSRRHLEIANIRHIVVSGLYAAAPALLVLLQPDLGTAVILGSIWFGMVLVSGIPKRHLAAVLLIGLAAAAGLWSFGLHDYQRARIMAFVNPAADIHGSGYNAYQATVAVGSGEWFGKGIGYGTQSKLRFLPQYETDFIFAAFAEEWGFVGVGLVLILYGLLLFRLIEIARRSATNFDALFTIGVAILIMAHVAIHAGINLGLLPVTGTTIPFMSYGGSHLVMEFAALGIVSSLAKYGRSAPREAVGQEYVG